MRLSPKITNFSMMDRDGLKLADSQGQLVFDYGASLLPVRAARSQAKTDATFSISKSSEDISEAVEANQGINFGESLTAATILNENEESQNGGSYVPIIIFSVFLSLSAGVVYLLRRLSGAPSPGDDFELLDE